MSSEVLLGESQFSPAAKRVMPHGSLTPKQAPLIESSLRFKELGPALLLWDPVSSFSNFDSGDPYYEKLAL